MVKPIKIRSKLKGNIVEIKALMPHDMESGLRRDPQSGELMPAHYITEVIAEHNGTVVFKAYWGPAVSKNPFVAFSFTGAESGGTVNIRWTDNRGDSSVGEIAI